jgi:hypothetical protein
MTMPDEYISRKALLDEITNWRDARAFLAKHKEAA